MKVNPCHRCGQSVLLVRTDNQKWMPLEQGYDEERGNVVIRDTDGRAQVFADTEDAKDFIFVHDGDGPYLPHATVCPVLLEERRRDREEPKQLGLGELAT